MAQMTVIKTQFTLEYAGEGGKSGGSYTCSSLVHTASDAQIDLAARAVGDLQAKTVSGIFKTVSAEIGD